MDGATSFFSLTSTHFPSSQSLATQVKIPLSVSVQPLAGGELPHASYGTDPVVRCHSCNGYICPFTVFSQAGHSWTCSLCSGINQVPEYFYAPLDSQGVRSDVQKRVELREMCYDVLAPEEYMLRPPMPPTYCFVLDISQASRGCGMLDSVCEVIESFVSGQSFPGLPRTQIALILFGHEVHLLGFPGDNAPVRIFSVGKAMEEHFLPVPREQLLISVSDNESSLLQAISAVRKLSAGSCLESSALRLALTYASLLLSDAGGKVLLFLGESNEIDTVQLRPETPVTSPLQFYRDLAVELTASAVCVDLFVAATKFCNLYSMGDLARFTSGKVFFYPDLRPSQRVKLRDELWANVARETVWDASLRIRVSRDWRPAQVYGHYHIRTSDLLSLPALDSTQTLTYDLALNVAVASSPNIHVQAALLYTTSDGDRRIRVLNCSVQVTDQLAEVYKHADAECVAGVWAKQALFRLLSSTSFETAKTYLRQQLTDFRASYASIRTEESDQFQFLPALVLGYSKLPALSGQVCGCES